MQATLPSKLRSLLLQATPEERVATLCYFLARSLADAQQRTPPDHEPASAQSCAPARELKAEIEGEPASGHFCIRVSPAKGNAECGVRSAEAGNAEPGNAECGARIEESGKAEGGIRNAELESGQEDLSMAAKLLQLLRALDSEQHFRKAPLIKVFLLRFRDDLSRREIARTCHCGLRLVALRLESIRENVPWRPQQLRELAAQVAAMEEALSDSRARRIYRKGAVYGDGEDGGEAD